MNELSHTNQEEEEVYHHKVVSSFQEKKKDPINTCYLHNCRKLQKIEFDKSCICGAKEGSMFTRECKQCGTSANKWGIRDISHPREVIGYEPEDQLGDWLPPT